MMATQSWLDAHRSNGPLRLAQRAGVEQPLLQRAALCALTANAAPRLLLQKLGRGRLLAAELRFPACAGAVATLTIEVDGGMSLERRWSLRQDTPIVSEVLDLDPALSYRHSLRLWLTFAAGAAPPWAAIEVAMEPGRATPAKSQGNHACEALTSVNTRRLRRRYRGSSIMTVRRCSAGPRERNA